MRRFKLSISVLLLLLLALPGQTLAAREPTQHNLGGTPVKLAPPPEHKWVNKKSDIGFKFTPERYSDVVDHMISVYSYSSSGSLSKLYNNYGAIFYVGPPDRTWTAEDFTLVKTRLLPGAVQDDEGRAEAMEYMRAFLRDGVGYKLSSSKTRRYFAYLQEATVISESPESLVMALRIKKKGEKTKYVTVSLSLVKEKLLGTLYYQVKPNGKERERARLLTQSWQEALVAANN